MRVVVILVHNTDPFFAPRLDLVPVLLAIWPGNTVRTRPAAPPLPAAPQTHTTAATAAGSTAAAAASEGGGHDVSRGLQPCTSAAAAASESTQAGNGHRLHLPSTTTTAAAIVVKLKRLADLRHQRVNFFRVDGDRLFQENVVLLPTRHFGGGSMVCRVCPGKGLGCWDEWVPPGRSSLLARCRHAAQLRPTTRLDL